MSSPIPVLPPLPVKASPKGRRRKVAVIIVVIILAAAALAAVSALRGAGTNIAAGSAKGCYSLHYETASFSELPSEESYGACLTPANEYSTPEVYYILTGPDIPFTVNATVSAQSPIIIQLVHANDLSAESGSARPLDASGSTWSVYISPCYGNVACSFGVVNNSTVNNHFNLNATLS